MAGRYQKLIDEFAAAPYARHSMDLHIMLNRVRGAPLKGKYCLIEREPHARWQLARHSGTWGIPPEKIDDIVFTSLLQAEIFIFELRVREIEASEDQER